MVKNPFSETIRSNELQKAQIATVPLPKCNETYMTFDGDANRAELRDGISHSQYCAQDPNGTKDSCQGDSG